MRTKDLLGKVQDVYYPGTWGDRRAYREGREDPEQLRWTCNGKGYARQGGAYSMTYSEVQPEETRVRVTHLRLTRPDGRGGQRVEFATPGQIIGLYEEVAAARRPVIAETKARRQAAQERQSAAVQRTEAISREVAGLITTLELPVEHFYRPPTNDYENPKIVVDLNTLRRVLMELAGLRQATRQPDA
jgi:hypothetical protein